MSLKEGQLPKVPVDSTEKPADKSRHKLTRRRFLKMAGVGGVTTLGALFLGVRNAQASPAVPREVRISGPDEPFDLDYLLDPNLKSGVLIFGFDPEAHPARPYRLDRLVSVENPLRTGDKTFFTSLRAEEYIFAQIAPKELSSSGGFSIVGPKGDEQVINVRLGRIITANEVDTPMNYIADDQGIPMRFGLTVGKDGFLKIINPNGLPRVLNQFHKDGELGTLRVSLYANPDSEVSLINAVKLAPNT